MPDIPRPGVGNRDNPRLGVGRADPGRPTVTVIDCDDCIGPTIGACDDCVVTFLCEREPDDAIVIDVAEERALRMLADADLAPRLRHVRRDRGVS